MTPDGGRRSLFAILLVTVPCPAVFLFCNGLLPVSALALALVNFVSVGLRDSLALLFAGVAFIYVVGYWVCLAWLSGVLSRRLSAFRMRTGWRARELLIVALVILAVRPVYSFDCMDGASFRSCNWFGLHLGWFRAVQTCGDVHW